MTDSKSPACDAESLPPRIGTSYPKPYDEPCAKRRKRALGDAFDLNDFGVNLVVLPPDCLSSQRHWHSHEDEFIYVLTGTLTLVTDAGETVLAPGMCAGFPAGVPDGHHLINKSDRTATYLEIGSRRRDDDVFYSDIDMQVLKRADGGTFTRKDGRPIGG
ncbi:MAG: cupin domain-containing protein [Rhodospirillales bacterium]|nr:cupin domain-containing protein [Rhodospirillales bacterium]